MVRNCQVPDCPREHYRPRDVRMPEGKGGRMVNRRLDLCSAHYFRALRSPENCPLSLKRALSDEDVAEIRRLWDGGKGMRQEEIAAKYDVDPTVITRRLHSDYRAADDPAAAPLRKKRQRRP